jgi:lysophospholipase L1-like esterase
MAFWQFTGTSAEYFPTLRFTAQPGAVYDLGSDSPPPDPFDRPDGDDRPPVSRWTTSPGPATDSLLCKLGTSSQIDTRSGTKVIPIAVGGYVTSATSQQSTTGTARVPYYACVAATDLRLLYTNWILSSISDADPASSLTISASIEYSGTIYRVTFAGATTVTVNPGGSVTSDPLGLDVPAGALLYVRTFTSGANWYGNRAANVSGFGGFTSTTDLTAPGSAAISDVTSFTNLIGPAAILGLPLTTGLPAPSVLGVGDSIMWGYGDQAGTGVGGVNTSNTNFGFGGFIARAANGHAGLINIGVASDTAQNFLTAAGHLRRMSVARHCGTAVCNYGRNDLTGGRTLAQVQADLIAVWTMLAQRRLRVFQTTITPRTTSTDAWLTTTNQTPGTGEASRVLLNDWLRAGAPIASGAAVAVGTSGAVLAGSVGHPLSGYFETADAVESARNSGLWAAAANVRTAADGAFASGTTVTGTAAFTSADVGRTITLAGAGAAGALYVGKIKSVTNSTTVIVVTAPSTVVSGAALKVGDFYTQDGIHPEPVGHAAMAGAVPTAAFV